MLFDSFKKETKGLRHGVALGALQLLAPRLKINMEDGLRCITETPRPFTVFLKNHFKGSPLIGVEIGFGFGLNAASILKELNMKRLYCVEPYIKRKYVEDGVEYGYVKGSLYDVISRKSNVEFINMKSDGAFKVLENMKFDFIYIDGYHVYDQVLKDILNAWECVKIGGFVGGHDFTKGCQEGVIPAVIKASHIFGLLPIVKVPDFWFSKTKGCKSLNA